MTKYIFHDTECAQWDMGSTAEIWITVLVVLRYYINQL